MPLLPLDAYCTGSGSVFSGVVAATVSMAIGSVVSSSEATCAATKAKKASTAATGGGVGVGAGAGAGVQNQLARRVS